MYSEDFETLTQKNETRFNDSDKNNHTAKKLKARNLPVLQKRVLYIALY